jgi:hypothetical protein
MINEITKGEKFESFYFYSSINSRSGSLTFYFEVNNYKILDYSKDIDAPEIEDLIRIKNYELTYRDPEFFVIGTEEEEKEKYFQNNIRRLRMLKLFEPNYKNLLFCMKLEKDLQKISKQLKPILIF